MTDHTITIATRQGPIDTLEPSTIGTLYRWECSCGKAGMSWRSAVEGARNAGLAHINAAAPPWEAAVQVAWEAVRADWEGSIHELGDDADESFRHCTYDLCREMRERIVPTAVKAALRFIQAEGR
jgi:hypothetical protein